MIDSIGLSGTDARPAQTQIVLCVYSGGGEIHGPEHHPRGSKVEITGCHNAQDFGTVTSDVVRGHGYAQARDAAEAASTSHVVQTRLGVEIWRQVRMINRIRSA